MKKILLLLLTILLISCVPKVVKQNGQNYSIVDWEGGQFVYATYIWEGGKFDDAIEIIEKFQELKAERNLNEQLIGRFPTGKKWQLGMLISGPLELKEIAGYSLDTLEIPAGQYGRLTARGYPEFIFFHWKRLKKWLIKDRYQITSPVFEIYEDDTFDKSIADHKRKGEIRYRIDQMTE